MKQNDWIVANLSNPTFDNSDFTSIGLTTSNTQLMPPSFYEQSQFIINNTQFQGNDGQFSKSKFEDYYKQKAATYNNFQSNDDTGYIYDMFDFDRKANAPVKSPHFQLSEVVNPDHVTFGVTQRFKTGERQFSPMELAQKNKVYNTKEGKFEDYTPNDNTLTSNPIGWFKSIFDDPLVLATYDEDTTETDPVTGQQIEHKKGTPKLDENGEYYMETLNGRSPLNKQVLSSFDTLTVDGEGLNKYDFFDSDGLDKSVGGTIAKGAVAIAPMFFGNKTKLIYGGLQVARELAKALPMLGQIGGALFGQDVDSPILNSIAAKGQQATSSTSEYSQSNVFTFENIGNLVTDISLQWGQQKAVSQAIQGLQRGSNTLANAEKKAKALYDIQAAKLNKAIDEGREVEAARAYLGKTDAAGNVIDWKDSAFGRAALNKFRKPIEDAVAKQARLGADASLAYMAIVSNTDAYQSMKDAGLTPQQAAWVALGSSVGMFAVDKTGLGELFFDDLEDVNKQSFKRFLQKEVKDNTDTLTATIQNKSLSSTKKAGELFSKGQSIGKNATNKFKSFMQSLPSNAWKLAGNYAEQVRTHTTGFLGKALGEGLEEVGEEVATDFAKTLIGGGMFGNMGDAWQNMGARYGMSLFGGALGGGLFYGVNAITTGMKSPTDTSMDELIYYARQGRIPEYLKELEKWRDEGRLGKTDISASKYQIDDAGDAVYLSTENKADSQNEYIYRTLRDQALQVDSIVNGNGVNLDEDALFKQMVLGDQRFLELADLLQDQSYSTGYQQAFQNTVKKLVQAEQDLALANKTKDGTANEGELNKDTGVGSNIASDEYLRNMSDEQIEARKKNIQKYKDARDTALKERDKFLSGEYSPYYLRKMQFLMDKNLSSPFMAANYTTWLEKNKKKKLEDLTPEESESYKQEYLQYKQNGGQALDSDAAFQQYLQFEKLAAPLLKNVGENAEKFKQFQDAILKLWGEESPFDTIEFDYGKKDETAEERDAREKKNEELRKKRYEQIEQIIKDAGGFIDPLTARMLRLRFENRAQDLVKNILNYTLMNMAEPVNLSDFGIQDPDKVNNAIKDLMSTLKPDLSNKEEIAEGIQKIITDSIKPTVESKNDFYKVISGLLEDYDLDTSLTHDNLMSALASVYNPDGSINEEDDLYEEIVNSAPSEEAAISFLNEIRNNPSFSYEIVDDVDKESAEWATKPNDFYQRAFNDILTAIQDDPDLKVLSKLDEQIKVTNPVMDILSKFTLSINPESGNIEEALKAILDREQNDLSRGSFQLDTVQSQNIDEIRDIIDKFRAYLYGASTSSSWVHPIGHNISVNEFAKAHPKEVKGFEELPTIPADIALMYAQELNKYDYLMNELEGESNFNKANKKLKFILSETNFNKARIDFWTTNRKAFTIEVKGHKVDLLEGFDAIDRSRYKEATNLTIINAIENTYYDNLHKFLSANPDVTFQDVLEAQKSIFNDDISKQGTMQLDENMEYSKMSSYDKAIYLLTISSNRSGDFNKFLKARIEADNDIAPLTGQEYVSRIAIASRTDMFKEGLKYFYSLDKEHKMPLLENIVYIDGVAGAGKSRVVGRNIVSSLNPDEKVWLSTPEATQEKTLKEAIGRGDYYSKEDLMKQAVDSTTLALLNSDLENKQKDSKFYSFNAGQGLDASDTITINFDNVKVKKIDNAPKIIVIDEATHFSNAYLQILNEFARVNGIQIVTLGDINQNGNQQFGYNLVRETTFMARTPKLGISIRDQNIQKMINLQSTLALLNAVQSLGDPSDPANVVKLSQIYDAIQSLNLRYFNGDTFTGEIITPSLDDTSKLNGTIGFVGNDSSPAYKALVAAGKDVTLLNASNVQGQEFDYVVIDKGWKLDNRLKQTDVAFFLKDLYTMISRSRKGTIIIDNGLTNIIGESIKEYNTMSIPPLSDAVEEFRQSKLKVLDMLDDTSKPEGPANLKPKEEDKGKEEPPKTEDEPETESDEGKGKIDETPPSEEKIEEPPKIDTPVIDEESDSSITDYKLPIRVYGAASFSGFNTDKDGNWINPHSEVARDLTIFTNADTISDGKEKDRLVRQLLNFKSTILFGHSYDSLSAENQKIFPPLDEIEYGIEVRQKADTDNFVGYTDLDGDQIDSYNGLVYAYVARFKTKDGRQAVITLGLLASPESFQKARDFLIDRANKRIEAETNPDEKKKLIEYRDQIDDTIEQYTKLIDNIKNNYKGEDLFFKVNNLMSKLTWLRHKSKNVEITPMTLSEFRKAHPYARISKPYIYTGDLNQNVLDGVGAPIRGRAVVFVTTDTTIDFSNPVELYEKQKRAIGNSKDKNPFTNGLDGSVRMIVLGNRGVSINDLCNPKLQDLYTTEKIVGGSRVVNTFPFQLDYMGYRMLASMWNFRASLAKFRSALHTFKDENGYTDEKLNSIGKASYKIWQRIQEGPYTQDDLDAVLDTYNSTVSNDLKVTKEDLDKVNHFNDVTLAGVREFRLGGSDKNQYIRTITGNAANLLYNGIDYPKGIYLSAQMADQYFAMIDATLKAFTDISALKMQTKDGRNWPIDAYVSEKDGYANSLKGLISDIRGTDYLEVYDNTGKSVNKIIFPSKSAIKWFPIAITRIFNHVKAYQIIDPSDYSDNMFKVRLRGDDGDYHDVNIGSILDLVKHNTEYGSEAIEDTRYSDMLNLIFHGTTENFDSTDMKASDAYFPHGLFIDPMSGTEEYKSRGTLLFRECITNPELLTVDVKLDLPAFNVTFSEMKDAVENPSSGRPTEETPINITEDINKLFPGTIMQLKQKLINAGLDSTASMLDSVIESIDKDTYWKADRAGKLKLLNDKIYNTTQYTIKRKLSDLNKAGDLQLNTIFGFKNGQFITIQDLILGKLKDIGKVEVDNGNLVVYSADGKQFVTVGYNENTEEIEVSDKETTDKNDDVYTMEDIKNDITKEADSNNIAKIDDEGNIETDDTGNAVRISYSQYISELGFKASSITDASILMQELNSLQDKIYDIIDTVEDGTPASMELNRLVDKVSEWIDSMDKIGQTKC